ncbi:MAG: hypothetical protein H6733_10935 [Alphaproteobacteria bacterium]|nr:hypothetical protein [Alphaproteobacteria bacterium]
MTRWLEGLALIIVVAACRAASPGDDEPSVDTDVADTDVADTDGVDTEVVDTDGVDTEVVDTDAADTDVVDTDVQPPSAPRLRLTPSVSYAGEPLWDEAAAALASAEVRLQEDLDLISAAQVQLALRVQGPCSNGPMVWRDLNAFLTVDDALAGVTGDAVLLLCPGIYRQPGLTRSAQQVRVGPARWGQDVAIRSDVNRGGLTRDTQLTVAGVTLVIDASSWVWAGSRTGRLSLIDTAIDVLQNGSLVNPGGEIGQFDMVRCAVTGAGGALFHVSSLVAVVAQNDLAMAPAATTKVLAVYPTTADHPLAVLADNTMAGVGADRSALVWGSANSSGTLVSIGNTWRDVHLAGGGAVVDIEGRLVHVGLFGDRYEGGVLGGADVLRLTTQDEASTFRAVDVTVEGHDDPQNALALRGPFGGSSQASWVRGAFRRNVTRGPAVGVGFGWTVRFEDTLFGTGADANTGGDATNCGPLVGVTGVVVTTSTCEVATP